MCIADDRFIQVLGSIQVPSDSMVRSDTFVFDKQCISMLYRFDADVLQENPINDGFSCIVCCFLNTDVTIDFIG